MRIEEIKGATLINGDCRDMMAAMEESSVDAIVCDPPYGIGFMGKGWDHGVPGAEFWIEALRVAKPGAHLLAFGGTRMFHRLMVAIEDAGWEIRDTIMWVYGSGFPKSLDVSKAIDQAAGAEREVVGLKASNRPNVVGMEPGGSMGGGTYTERVETAPATDAARQWQGWGTALKPAWEPIIVARKPLAGTVAGNVVLHGTGALNIDGCRVVKGLGDRQEYGVSGDEPSHTGDENTSAYGAYARVAYSPHDAGRWPANLIHDGSDEVLALFPDSNGSGGSLPNVKITGYGDGAVGTGKAEYFGGPRTPHDAGSGSAARFFKECAFDEIELLFWRAKAIFDVWNLDYVSTAISPSPQSGRHGDSVLSDVVTLASRGGKVLSAATGLSTVVMPNELRTLSESLTAAILGLECAPSPVLLHAAPFPNGSHVSSVRTQEQTGITTITISHWRYDGSAGDATFDITPANSVVGERGFAGRFKYCAKTSRTDRNEGCDRIERKPLNWSSDTQNPGSFQGEGTDRTSSNSHPTVKPTALMRYLCRLVTPPGGLVLDPFMGSGSTGKAALLEGFQFVGIDNDVEHGYFDIALARIRHAAL